jgi:hypothetical protein
MVPATPVARGDEGEDSVVHGETISSITDDPVAKLREHDDLMVDRRPASSRAGC